MNFSYIYINLLLFSLFLVNAVHCKPVTPNGPAYVFNNNLNCTIPPGCNFDDQSNWLNGTAPPSNANAQVLFDVTSDDVNYLYSNGSSVVGYLLVSGNVVFNNLNVVNATIMMYSNLTVNTGLATANGSSHFFVDEKAALSLYLQSPISIGNLFGGYGSECYFMAPLLNFTNVHSSGYITLTNSTVGITSINASIITKLALVSSDLYVFSDLVMSNYSEISMYRDKYDELNPPIVVAGNVFLAGWIDITEASIDKTKDYYLIESQSNNITGKFQQESLISDGELEITDSSRYLQLSFPQKPLPPGIIFLIVLFSLIFLVIASFLIYVLVKCCRERRRRSRYSSLN